MLNSTQGTGYQRGHFSSTSRFPRKLKFDNINSIAGHDRRTERRPGGCTLDPVDAERKRVNGEKWKEGMQLKLGEAQEIPFIQKVKIAQFCGQVSVSL